MIATAPGKLILTGEYAVLDGAPALVIAVNRRVIARHRDVAARGSSPFLLALAEELPAAIDIECDSSAFFAGTQKLGLGSSAAVTVAATALALGTIDRAEILRIASAAHARAQRGKGSGADIAASTFGGVLEFRSRSPKPEVRSLTWPAGVRLLPFFTGESASTTELVAKVMQKTPAVEAALAAIRKASEAACAACATRTADLSASALISALALGAQAMDRLAVAAEVPLVPACVKAARTALARLGGTAKTTGAGGGDVGIAVIPGTEDVTVAERLLIQAGCQPLVLAIDSTGVDLAPNAL